MIIIRFAKITFICGKGKILQLENQLEVVLFTYNKNWKQSDFSAMTQINNNST